MQQYLTPIIIHFKLHGRAALVEYSTKNCQIQLIGIFNQFWLKSQPKAKIQNKNDVIITQDKKMICVSIKSVFIFTIIIMFFFLLMYTITVFCKQKNVLW